METFNFAQIAEEFLASTDDEYVKCSREIAQLDRIIVSVASSLAPLARSALLPVLYSYWERFFRVVFSEYVRCLSRASIRADCFCDPILKFRLRGELRDIFKSSQPSEVVARSTGEEARAHFRRLHEFFETPLVFANPTDWVRTDSNVSSRVLENNCANLGVDIDVIRRYLGGNRSMESRLNELVARRNAIAHGDQVEPIEPECWEEHRTFVLHLMHAVQLALYDNLCKPENILRK